MLINPAEVSCHYLISERFFSPFTTFGSRYIICVIAFDRFMRIKYLQDYEIKFAKSWYRLVLFTFYLSVLYQTFVPSVLHIFYGIKSTVRFGLPVNIIVFLLAAGLYIESFCLLNQYKKSQQSISNTNSDIAKITKFYFLLYLISSTCLLCLSISNWFGKTRFGGQWDTTNKLIVLATLNIIPNLTGIINAVVILAINRAIKKRLLSTWLLKLLIQQHDDQTQHQPDNKIVSRPNNEEKEASL